MQALIRKSTGECEAIVHSTDGYDLAEFDVIQAPADPDNWIYAGGQWVARPATVGEEFAADPRWTAIKTATAAQIETWLTSNVTNLSEARQVLKFLILAVRALHERKLL